MTLRSLRPRIGTLDTSIAKAPPKRADAELLTSDHREWRATVLKRAGFRCEWVDAGVRCTYAAADGRLIADHIEERKDGGAKTDPANGMCLCPHHHALKTNSERAKRMAR